MHVARGTGARASDLDGTLDTLRVEVKLGVFLHNHRVDEAAFATYPSSRGIKDRDAAVVVDAMVKHGVKRSRIYDYILEKGENLIMSDVNNIVNSYRAQATDMNDDDAAAVALFESSAADANNVVTVDETARASRRAENESAFMENRVGILLNEAYDEEMQNLLHLTTHFMAAKNTPPPLQSSQVNATTKRRKRTAAERYNDALPSQIVLEQPTQLVSGINEDKDATLGDDDTDFESTATSLAKIKLNDRVQKTGRPKNDRKLRDAQDKKDMITFNASEKAKRDLGEVTLQGVLNSLLETKPSADDALKRIGAIPVKFQQSENKKPKYSKQKNPIAVVDVFYLLPPRLLDACIRKFPLANSDDDAISVYSQSQSQSNSQSQPSQLEPTCDGEIKNVTITNVGIFTRATIQAMKALSDLRAAYTRAAAICRWMQPDMAVAVRAEDQDEVKMLSSMILSTFPYDVVAILGTDYHYHMLYRLQPPHYVSDALIRALCERLESHHLNVRYGGMLTAKATKKRREQVIDESIRAMLTLFADTEGISGVMLPVNFGNQHWCCIIVDFVGSAIRYYDPLNSRDYRTALDGLSWQISTTILTGFKVASYQGLESENLTFWFRELEIAMSAARIHDERLRVTYAMSHLQGRARSWALTWETNAPGHFSSWEGFKVAMLAAFQPPNVAHRQRTQFLNAPQGKRELYEFVQELPQASW
ncbi:hypothetical protein ATCC90586_011968 [Pythium insidiosum]|nr:hypothetical protein ATCC90586_011968 [Pythium insidiosum]